jgi:hypothetical protein
MMDGGRFSTRQLSQHHSWPNLTLPAPPPLNPIVQTIPNNSSVKSCHASKRLKTEANHAFDKEKSIASPSSPSNESDKSLSSHMHLRDDYSHMISKIKPK